MSWYQLLDVLKERRSEAEFYASRPPVACPNDGTPLVSSPSGADSQLFCPHDGWKYPQDYDPVTQAGM